jgi:sugar phosphate isomerase/epimerase
VRPISCSTHLFVYEVLGREQLAMIRQSGFEAVELWAMRPHWDYGDDGHVAAVAETCERLGLTITSVHGPFYRHVEDAKEGRWLTLYHEDAAVRAEALAEFRRVVGVASALGAADVVLHWEEWGRGEQELSALIEAAGEAGVRLALENSHNRKEASVGTLAAVLERLGPEAPVGFCFDTGHAHIAEADLAEALKAAAPHVVAFHVHDNDGTDDSHDVPYRGTIDWAAFASAVETLGLADRPLTLELRRRGPYMDDLRASVVGVERMFGGVL